jgi:hypothetical protein
MTNDRDLWTDPRTGKLWNPRQILGRVAGTTDQPPYYDPAAWPDIRAAMAEKGFWPLYSGRNIDHFITNMEEVTRWVCLEAAKRKYGTLPERDFKVVFRRMARNTDERTCIAGILPPASCFADTLFGINVVGDGQQLCTLLNSWAFDYAIRLRIAGANLSFTYMERSPSVPPADVAPTVQIEFDRQRRSIYDDTKVWPSIWLANRAIAEAYGLGPDDFAYILSTFPVFARKRPAFYAYLQERVQEWKREVEPGTADLVPLAAEAPAGYRTGTTAPMPRQSPSPRRR